MIHRKLERGGRGASSVFEDFLFGAQGERDSGGTFPPQWMMSGGRCSDDGMGISEARGTYVNPQPD